ncbi:hypothetical protein BACCELL_03675 [Bacteroides cellulosilyticus DSM 14838]|uniref:Uncharacterized protein n=1 Tax=Bacteroides cellulosilyticus DSM 14838 TaxID=537012 RepID=E2NH99_9BACE|nr:hypothetical protein BACCELL_03675 [Bacteroides cellulosilyticus DSM 14838]
MITFPFYYSKIIIISVTPLRQFLMFLFLSPFLLIFLLRLDTFALIYQGSSMLV